MKISMISLFFKITELLFDLITMEENCPYDVHLIYISIFCTMEEGLNSNMLRTIKNCDQFF